MDFLLERYPLEISTLSATNTVMYTNLKCSTQFAHAVEINQDEEKTRAIFNVLIFHCYTKKILMPCYRPNSNKSNYLSFKYFHLLWVI